MRRSPIFRNPQPEDDPEDDPEDFGPEDTLNFMSGDCWLMAAALHEVTGLPIFGAIDRRGNAQHAFVMDESSETVIDGMGTRSLEDMLSGCAGKSGVMPLSHRDLARLAGGGAPLIPTRPGQPCVYGPEEWEYALSEAEACASEWRNKTRRNPDDRLRRLEREAAQSPDDKALAERLEAERARTEHGWIVEQRRSALLADLESFSLSLHNPRPNWLMLERLSGVMADFAGLSVDSVMQRFSAAAREYGREGMSLWGTEQLMREVGLQGLARAIADASNAQIRRYATVRDDVGRRTGQW